MNVLGIVAEFNPLHTGHEYLIRKLRRETDAAFCVVAMSGDYVQRGEPAFFAKSLRTKAALLSGADLVLELPLSVSTGSAEYFAEGAVSLLDRTGCVTHLGFGSENGDIDAFRHAGKLLSEESETFRHQLQANLKAGMNFPKARYEALANLGENCTVKDTLYSDMDSFQNAGDKNVSCHTGSDCRTSHEAGSLSDVLPLLTDPNNILGAEYCKALYKLHSPMIPVTARRLGDGYHDMLIDSDGEYAAGRRDEVINLNAESAADHPLHLVQAMPSVDIAQNSLPRYASASGLRKAFLSCLNAPCAGGKDLEALLQNYVPSPCRPLYAEALRAKQYAVFDQFFFPLCHTLLYSDAKALSGYQDVTVDFAERLLRLFGQCSSMLELHRALKTKNMTSARINRALLHILLRLTKEEADAERKQGSALYARILGFRREAAPLLSEIDRCATIPLVSKLADAKDTLPPLALAQLDRTAKASELYRTATPNAGKKSEYAQAIVIL